ncbi:GNAT family N-acetyltransferase [Pseudomonas sp. Fl5BN2]|uniref:GNAT family N-acetyltransferase n=1 Tax=unclassified Pseudomonas TaxID=196821 RepID=UPI001378FBCA|nr:GNAT family N-acetyltransferase [Pseudomonas sp. Fl5BN2]NBF13226.1 GNAT family N-acetyltransferase [Pseudomonas sp. Fl4BN1]
MNIEVKIAPKNSQGILTTMLVDYLQELGVETEYPYLPLYWEEPERHPYFILANDKVAGFALVRTLSDAPLFEMAEFFVAKSYRGDSIGREAVRTLFKLHAGAWRVSTMIDNVSGLKFWRAVVPADTPVSRIEEPGEAPYVLLLFNTAKR